MKHSSQDLSSAMVVNLGTGMSLKGVFMFKYLKNIPFWRKYLKENNPSKGKVVERGKKTYVLMKRSGSFPPEKNAYIHEK